jgi:Surface-adhesin protein E
VMKKYRGPTVLAVVLALGLFSSLTLVEGADWKLCTENPFLKAYYDTGSVTRPSGDLVRIWVKYLSKGKKGTDFWIHLRKLDKLPTEGYKHFSYHVALYEIDCREKTYQRISGIDFDQEKRMLNYFPPSNWEPIFPESMLEAFYKTTCLKEK